MSSGDPSTRIVLGFAASAPASMAAGGAASFSGGFSSGSSGADLRPRMRSISFAQAGDEVGQAVSELRKRADNARRCGEARADERPLLDD